MKNTYNFDFNQGEFVMSGSNVSVLTAISALRLCYGFDGETL